MVYVAGGGDEEQVTSTELGLKSPHGAQLIVPRAELMKPSSRPKLKSRIHHMIHADLVPSENTFLKINQHKLHGIAAQARAERPE